MTRFFVLLSLTLLFAACTEPPKPCVGDECPKPITCDTTPGLAKSRATPSGITHSSTFQACYARSASKKVSFQLQLKESIIPSERVQFVVDIVDANEKTVLSQFFSGRGDVSVSPDVFTNGASKAELVTGIDSTITFKFKSNAPVGEPFYFVISMFKSPGSTSARSDLIGRIIFTFKMAEQ
jgi:hypothetical protein